MSEMARLAPSASSSDVDRYWSLLRSGPSTDHPYVSLLGLRTFDTAGLLNRIAKGLSFRSWERFVRATELPRDLAASVVGITPRTLARRKDEGRLHADESDRLIRLTRIFAGALVLFEGDADAARGWLLSAQPALGGATPLDYASTEVGSREVEALIGRLEHGIPS